MKIKNAVLISFNLILTVAVVYLLLKTIKERVCWSGVSARNEVILQSSIMTSYEVKELNKKISEMKDGLNVLEQDATLLQKEKGTLQEKLRM